MRANSDKLTGKKKADRRLGRRIIGLFRPYRGRVFIIGFLVLVAAALGIVNPLMIRVIFDSALFPKDGSPNIELLWLIAGVMVVITVVSGGLQIWQSLLANKMGQRIMRDLREELYRHLHRQSLGFFTSARTLR